MRVMPFKARRFHRQLQGSALGLALALMTASQPALAQPAVQPRITPSQQGAAISAYETITPDLSIRDLSPGLTGDDGSSREVTGQAMPLNTTDIYSVNAYDTDVTFTQAGPAPEPNYAHRENPQDRAGRYYGAVYNSGDLTSAAYTTDDYSAANGKVAMRSRRLGVFDQGYADKREFSIKPYIEASQVVEDYITPAHDVMTYTVISAGGDAVINGRNNQGVISVRLEERVSEDRTQNSTGVSGIARLSSSLVPDTLRVDYGAYANRVYVTAGGETVDAGSTSSDSLTQLYAVYAGPTFSQQFGDVAVTAHYHAGYAGADGGINTTVGNSSLHTDILGHSIIQDAKIAIGTRAGEGLPVGTGLDASWYRENVSNLDQQVLDRHVRGEVSIPVDDTTALVGGVGYEHVTVGSRNAVMSGGAYLTDSAGNYITDYSTPRYVAFESEGLIWDAGVVWRPSRRTNLELHVGRRYGEVGAYGFFNYQPDDRTAFNVVLYNGVTGFGGSLTNSLFNMPTQFVTVRDAITGNLTSCMSSMQGGSCLAGATGSLNSTVYRGRGVSTSYSKDLGRWQFGFGAGYDRREYLTAQETVLAAINGKVDEYYWLAAYMGARLSEHSTFQGTLDLYNYQSGLTSYGNMNAVRAVALYQHYLSSHLSASASLAVDGVTRTQADDSWSTYGSVGMRYSF